MNIIFMGTPRFAEASLKILLNSHHKISAVVTVPDKEKGRGLKLAQSEVKKFAQQNELNILQPLSLKDKHFIKEIKSLKPDLIVVVAFKILPKEIFTIPEYGSINLHASILPKYRGAAPINWAIINGEKETGVTTFFLKDKVDTGNIILQNYCDISKEDDAGSLHDKLMGLGALTVYSTVSLIESSGGNPPVIKQDEFEASPAPKIFKDDCLIKWNEPAEKVYNFIRGLSPYPCAYTGIKKNSLKIFKTIRSHSDNTGKPGSFSVKEGKIFVSCIDEKLEIIELQLEGKRRMSALDFLNGNRELFR